MILALSLLTPSAHAAPTVVLLRPTNAHTPSWRAAEARTRDELRLLGVHVDEVPDPANPNALARILDEHGADLAIRLQRTGTTAHADLWLRTTTTPQHLHLADLPSTGHEAPALVALRTAELVHVTLSQQSPPPPNNLPPPPPPPIIPPPVPDPTIPSTPPPTTIVPTTIHKPPPAPPHRISAPKIRPPSFGLRGFAAHIGIVGGPGGARSLLDLSLALRWGLTPRLSLQPGIFTAASPSWPTPTGAALRLGLIGAQAMLMLMPTGESTRVAPVLGLGGGLAIAWAHGTATTPLRAGTDITMVGTITALAGLAIRLHPRVRLHLGPTLGLLVPPVAIRETGTELARLGTPLLRGQIGLEWRLPRHNIR